MKSMAKFLQFQVGLLFGLAVVLVDVALRHETLSSFSLPEKRQYALSIVGCLFFWSAIGSLLHFTHQLARTTRDSKTLALMHMTAIAFICFVAAAMLAVPYLVWLNLGRFPSEEMAIFLSNERGFVSRLAENYFGLREVICIFSSLFALFIFALVTRRRSKKQTQKATLLIPLTALVALAVVMTVSTFAKSHPFTPEQNSIRLLALLLKWGSHPPQFFNLGERVVAMPIKDSTKSELKTNVLFIVGETFAQKYITTPNGTVAAPHLKSAMTAARTINFSNMHSNSTCTDISFPSLLGGMSPLSSPRELQAAWLLFDEAKTRGAYTFVASAHRLDWANIENFLGARRFDSYVDARDFDATAEADSNIPDSFAYEQALKAMGEASQRQKKFAGLLHVNTLHGPYWPDPTDSPFTDTAGFPTTDSSVVKYLNAMVRFDKQFGAFFDAFQNEPSFNDTLIVFTADHGESFGEHHLSSHCNSFFPEETHVPSFIQLPKALATTLEAPLRKSSTRITTNLDLLPTVYDILQWPKLDQFAGHSLLQKSNEPTLAMMSNCSQVRQCSSLDWGFQKDSLRFIFKGATNSWAVYDLIVDAEAHVDISAAHREELSEVLRTLKPTLDAALQK
jgi:glucan phosphoethanolaminetransferase (alkaline phosphatase superfamily)